ncbi:hypothetical protein R1flu_006014 [Riccia fluitans]|uniref:Uncharacterized protein n=1 Tax=Riccia fluitans TaxID=41844 RepID=A0ABD1YUT0_9MARC
MDRKSITKVQQSADIAASVDYGDRRASITSDSNESQELTKDEKRKKRQRKSKKQAEVWTSEEYKLAASDPNMPGFKAPHYKPPRVSPEFYQSSQYDTETKKRSSHPWSPLKDNYLSEEYRKQYPLPPISIPGCPVGHTPQEGPWVKFYDSMWGIIWVSLKGTDTTEASKNAEWSGFNWREDHIA